MSPILKCIISCIISSNAKTSNMPSAGSCHTVLLTTAGSAAAFGDNDSGQCDIPALREGVIYSQAAAGRFHTVLLKSDGTAAAFGDNLFHQCNILALPASDGISYVGSGDQRPRTILNIQFGTEYAAFYKLNGEEVFRVQVNALDTLEDLHINYLLAVAGESRRFRAVLPTGVLLDELLAQTPAAPLEPWLPRKRARVIE